MYTIWSLLVWFGLYYGTKMAQLLWGIFRRDIVQQQLGHSSVQTTTVYANVMSEDVEKAVNGIIKES